MHKRRKFQIVLFALFGVFLLAWVFTQAGVYGQTMDEPLRDRSGQSMLGWYTTLGKDTSIITASPSDESQQGTIFDAVPAGVEQLFSPDSQWYIHAVVIGLAGVAGVIGITLCGYELAGLWGAVLAALGLWLYPRYSGALFTNSRDIPFAATMTFVLWSVLLLVKNWESKRSFWYTMLTGFWIGFAASIQVMALLWYGILGLMLASWWLISGPRAWQKKQVLVALWRHMTACIGISSVSVLTMMALWPSLFLSSEFILRLSHDPWNGTVLAGTAYSTAHLPRLSALVWLVIGSPSALVLCALLGLVTTALFLLRKRVVDPKMAVISLAFLVPLAAIVGLHAVPSGTLRPCLFLVPPMILLAVYGVIHLSHFLISHQQKAVAAGLSLLLISYGFVVKDIADLYPYEDVYFSPLVGGLQGATNTYEVDPWGACQKASAEWLAHHYQRYTNKKHPSVEGVPHVESLVTMYLPRTFHVDEKHPDFYVAPIERGGRTQYPSYHVIYMERREGVPLCVVKAR